MTNCEKKMLPCPFCGAQPVLWPGKGAGAASGTVSPYCEGCGATFAGGAVDGADRDGWFTEQEKAVAYWNRRASSNADYTPK